MDTTTVYDDPVFFQKMAEAARACLRNSPHRVSGGVSCDCDHGVLFLRGRLSSFHRKQVAQEAVARVKGVTRVVNEIEVDQPSEDY